MVDWYEFYNAGRYSEARPLLEQEAAKEPVPGEMSLFLGAVQTLLDKDRRHIDSALEITRGNVAEDLAMAVAGCILWDIGLHDEGAAKLRKACSLCSSVQNLSLAARRFEKDPSFDEESVLLYNRILAETPRDAGTLVGRGAAKEGKAVRLLDEALRDFKLALEIDPQEPSAHYEMGNILGCQGELEEALLHFKLAAALKYWRLHCAYAGTAYCLKRLGRFDEAMQAVMESLRVKPDYEYAQELRGEIESAINTKMG